MFPPQLEQATRTFFLSAILLSRQVGFLGFGARSQLASTVSVRSWVGWGGWSVGLVLSCPVCLSVGLSVCLSVLCPWLAQATPCPFGACSVLCARRSWDAFDDNVDDDDDDDDVPDDHAAIACQYSVGWGGLVLGAFSSYKGKMLPVFAR